MTTFGPVNHGEFFLLTYHPKLLCSGHNLEYPYSKPHFEEKERVFRVSLKECVQDKIYMCLTLSFRLYYILSCDLSISKLAFFPQSHMSLF